MVRNIVRVVAATIYVLALTWPSPAAARAVLQEPDSSQVTVYLVTVGPGEQVWEQFGHNAIWISDDSSGFNRAYNYGLFSFQQDGFVTRFLQGRMEYWMRGFDTDPHLQGYVLEDRSVWIQELNLSTQQKTELRDFLVWNELPEKRFYRYHYYYDNCSTRIRDAIDRVLEGIIEDQTGGVFPGATLRYHSLRLVSEDLLVYSGLLLGLGQPVDQPLSAWDEMFLPLKLRDHLRNVVLRNDDGTEQPLVLSERTLYESTEFVENAAPPKRTIHFLAVGMVLALGALLLAHMATERPGRRIFFAGAAATWYAIVGIAGVGLAALWMFTDHDTSYRNENLFWFDPVAVLLIVLAPLLVFRVQWSIRAGRLAAVFVAGAALLGLALQIVPGMDQVNGPLIALTLPPNLAFAVGILWYSSVED